MHPAKQVFCLGKAQVIHISLPCLCSTGFTLERYSVHTWGERGKNIIDRDAPLAVLRRSATRESALSPWREQLLALAIWHDVPVHGPAARPAWCAPLRARSAQTRASCSRALIRGGARTKGEGEREGRGRGRREG
eukprot:3952084-Pleurochrysis_carterae.AAC.2